MATNFHIAPPPKNVDGLLAVPIDIQTINGSFIFDAGAQTAVADVTILYTVGPAAGNPVFDLRQTITQAWLDGAIFPAAQLASHSFGPGSFDKLRIIESLQAAGSVHTLRVQYDLAVPQSQLGGSYLPALEWLAGPSLKFVFGLSDLNAARYAEAWLPANLPFDQYSIDLDIQIINTLASHAVISNATITVLGANHWSLSFPSRFTAVSPLLEIRAASTLESLTGSVTLPVSGSTVTIEAWKIAGTATNLATQISNISTLLSDNENDYGGYVHGNRFVAFFNGGGGMEYEGGTTTATTALGHETFHSWFARGVKPAAQADGWWDEAFTEYHDNGANDTLPFDFGDAPIVLCSLNPWQRTTPSNSYSDGFDFWKGIAAITGVAGLNNVMSSFFNTYKGNSPVSTQMLEEFLICHQADDQVVDAFHRFIYGFTDDATGPELWMKDDTAHSGSDSWAGAFWDSPDLWIRNEDDDGSTHQAPEYGQDNWFYARVRNKSTAGVAKHFVVAFSYKEWAGTEFVYPGDFLPAVAAKAEFDLQPGETRIVKAKWPRNRIPAAGKHACILASVIARNDHPTANRHVWEHNNLAQKNTTVVNLQADEYIIIPVLLKNVGDIEFSDYTLEVWRDKRLSKYAASIVHKSKEFFSRDKNLKISSLKNIPKTKARPAAHDLLDCGGHINKQQKDKNKLLLTSRHPELVAQRFPNAFESFFEPGNKAAMKIQLLPHSQRVAGFKIQVPANAKKGTCFKTHLVQRNSKRKRVTGGITVEIMVM
ncbi:MAG: hypothetical protein WAT19_05395 [Ferruginibacter sp.]